MPSYKAPLENMRFILHDVLGVAQLAEFRLILDCQKNWGGLSNDICSS